ncbi:prolyl oligopeptidase family serine peptidase [Aliiglaciecola sp. LCG003]|uniref:alpha/beta hydrolase family protein n=1 Tax=Aliiglaciecola sp. LCG003 TaxID=3053655 RepID=UPI002572E77A|nr:prolyl oligopeptidase family serine peptidase [Aliiglaciecola sp. LCG003]WJG10135.1 prolyl oligopeptidase family serine peptidase [Aliiglaciecola sp. LCG003]
MLTRMLLALSVLLLVPTANSTAYSAQSVPTDYFSRLPAYAKPGLSPSGNKVAFIRNFEKEQLAVLTTLDMVTGETLYLLKTDNEKIKIKWFEWANDKTLIVSAKFASKRKRTATMETRLVVIDATDEREEARPLIGRREHISQFQDNVIDFLPDDPEHILIALDQDTVNLPSVYKVNIYSGEKTRIERGKRQVRDWLTDQQGRLRIGYFTNYKTGEKGSIISMPETPDSWDSLFEYDGFSEQPIFPIGFAKDPDVLYYKRYNGDKKALYKMNIRTKQEELVFADPQHDVDGSLIYSKKTKEVIGLRDAHVTGGRLYWDKDRANLQKAFDKALPDTSNYLVDFSADENIYILYTESDSIPGAYYYGNRDKKTLHLLFEQYPELNGIQIPQHKLITYKARDGVEIQGYLTLPLGFDGPVSTILMPHGGPGAREYDGFDTWTAFLTNQGYAVFRPNFRGSSGYGYEFSQSQMKGWGLEMQDDLADAVTFLVNQKIATPEKVCIVGGSYGGYAAMMGIVKTPDLYKCAVSFAGVSNLKKLVISARKYTNAKFVKNQIGDDYDDLENRSPYYNVEKIKTPILLIHGQDDRVVNVAQSREMADELEDEDKEFEYIELEHGDHNLSVQKNRSALFDALDAFLAKHLD